MPAVLEEELLGTAAAARFLDQHCLDPRERVLAGGRGRAGVSRERLGPMP